MVTGNKRDENATMKKEQLIQIAKAGFPECAKKLINFKDCEMLYRDGLYWLYDKDEPFYKELPVMEYLTIFIGENKYVHLSSRHLAFRHLAFNHYAAIKEMERMGLV